jgi:hypothetical protein
VYLWTPCSAQHSAGEGFVMLNHQSEQKGELGHTVRVCQGPVCCMPVCRTSLFLAEALPASAGSRSMPLAG